MSTSQPRGSPGRTGAEAAVTLPRPAQPLRSPPVPCCRLGCCTGGERLPEGSAAGRLAMLGVAPRPHFIGGQPRRRPPLAGGSTRNGQERTGREPRDDRDAGGVPWSALIWSNWVFKAVWVPLLISDRSQRLQGISLRKGTLQSPPQNISPARNPVPQRCGIASHTVQSLPTLPSCKAAPARSAFRGLHSISGGFQLHTSRF